MSWLYGIHATRSEFANSIRSNGLRPGGGKGLWLGKAAYLAIVSNVADLEAATDYGGKFVQKADKPNETPHFFLFRMRASKCICLQNKTTTAELRKFGAAFDAKAKQLGFELPANQVNSNDRPASYIRYECLRKLVGEMLSDDLAAIAVRFMHDHSNDTPEIEPAELAVYDPNALQYVADGCRSKIVKDISSGDHAFTDFEEMRRVSSLEFVGAIASSVSRLENMHLDEFVAMLTEIGLLSEDTNQSPELETQRFANSNEAPHLLYRSAVRARHFVESFWLHDARVIHDDFVRRKPSGQDQMALDLRSFDGAPREPKAAALYVANLARGTNDSIKLNNLIDIFSVSVRRLNNLEGTAYFFPSGTLDRNAIIVTGKSRNRTVKNDWLHEYGHLVFAEFGITGYDEELWADEFADEMQKLID